jgi:hypothetical protein
MANATIPVDNRHIWITKNSQIFGSQNQIKYEPIPLKDYQSINQSILCVEK